VWLERGFVHVWLFALIAAALAPSCIKLFVRVIERRVKARTEEMLARAEQANLSIKPRSDSSNVSDDREKRSCS
jgi:hypothetical protein